MTPGLPPHDAEMILDGSLEVSYVHCGPARRNAHSDSIEISLLLCARADMANKPTAIWEVIQEFRNVNVSRR